MSREKYAIVRRGSWYAVDDRGAVVWVLDSGLRMELDERAAAAIVASYATSTRRGMRIIKIARVSETV